MRPLEIAAAGPYNVFFLLALAIGCVIAWRQGRRFGAPRSEWIAVLALTAAAGLVGARLLHFDPGAPAGAKTILGGVTLAVVALYAGVRFLRLDPRSPDALAVALPLGFATGRIGCLLAGCCFGHPTDLPWGAIYDSHSAAFRAQLEAGLISADALAALPVHPTQLYEATLALLVAAAVPHLRRIVRQPGSLLLAVLVALASGRLLLEFFRARESLTFAGMMQVQWLIAGAACIATMLLICRERRPHVVASAAPQRHTLRLMCALSAAPVLLLAGGASFSPLERLALALIAVAPVIALLVPIVSAAARTEHALASPPALSCGLLLLALQQQPLADSTSVRASSEYPRSSWSLGFSAAASEDWEDRVVGTVIDDCGESVVTERFDLRYRIGGAALSHTTESAPGRGRTIRLRGFAGTERAASPTPAAPENTTLGGIGTSLTFDRPWYGATGGVAAGRFSGDTTYGSVVAIAAIRIGRVDGLHGFAGINDVEPLGQPEDDLRIGLGYGFPGGSAVRAGLWRKQQPFIGGTIAVRGFELEPSFMLADDYDVRLGISHRFALSRR